MQEAMAGRAGRALCQVCVGDPSADATARHATSVLWPGGGRLTLPWEVLGSSLAGCPPREALLGATLLAQVLCTTW